MLFEEVIGALRAGRTIRYMDFDITLQYDNKYGRIKVEGCQWYLLTEEMEILLYDRWEILD